ncbi:MAG TPA: DUF4239 domain-containing protein [Chloroflexota bacterium]|nr:DUF4239 domain-containing protein [Chloroflexota bacterium]
MLTAIQGIVFVVATVLLALGAMSLVRRTIKREALKSHHDVAGFVYAVLGVIYAVLLAFVVIVVWQQFDVADQHSQEEAAAIANIYRLALSLPEAERLAIRQTLVAYVDVVVDEEWATMARGEESPHASQLLNDVWRAFRRIEPRSEQEKAVYAEAMTQLTTLGKSRWQRLFDSREGLQPIMWTVLLVGGTLTVGFSLLFAVEDWHAHAMITGSLTATIAIMLFLIYAFDYPFRGDVRVKSEPFEAVLSVMEIEAQAESRSAGR